MIHVEFPLDLVRTFAEIVAAGSLDAAAARLQVTPSAISQRLKALESRLGRVLLVRSKPVQVTPAGAAVLRLARQLAAIEQDALTELGVDEAAVAGVPLAVNADSLATWFLPALAPLAADGMTFELFRDDQDYTAGLLESGTVSAAVTSQQRPVAGCSSRRLGAIRYLPVAAAGFAAKWFGHGQRSSAASAPLVDFDRRDALQSRYLAQIGADPSRTPRHYVPASADFAAAVILGFGWALVPEQQAVPALTDGRLVRLSGDHLDVPLYWQRWKLESPVLTRIEDAVVGAARSVLRPASP